MVAKAIKLFQAKILMANDTIINGYVMGHIEQHKSTFDPNNMRDFIDLYLKVVHDGTKSPTYTSK